MSIFDISFSNFSDMAPSWDCVETDFGDETRNFGPRQESGSALYEVNTIATIGQREPVIFTCIIACCSFDISPSGNLDGRIVPFKMLTFTSSLSLSPLFFSSGAYALRELQ